MSPMAVVSYSLRAAEELAPVVKTVEIWFAVVPSM
jgi:hypothetical protein